VDDWGVLEVDDAGKDALERRFRISPAHAEVLIDADSLNYLAPLASAFAALARKTDRIVEVYRTGEGVSWGEFGAEMRYLKYASHRFDVNLETKRAVAAVVAVNTPAASVRERVQETRPGLPIISCAVPDRGEDLDPGRAALASGAVALILGWPVPGRPGTAAAAS